jgi:hypothetical protein
VYRQPSRSAVGVLRPLGYAGILTFNRIILNDAVVLIRRPVLSVSIAVGLILIVGLVILSPLALAGIAHFRSDWLQLSNIGQTYGAISAILSALALGGIVASLLYQSRDSRIAHEQMTRTFQFELIKLELEDPSLMAATGAPWGIDVPSDSDSLREFLYVQMWVSYLVGIYATGALSASTARQIAALELFRGKAGRAYWEAVGRRQIENSKGRYNNFYRLLDDEYRRAVSSGIPVNGPINIQTIQTPPAVASRINAKKFERAGIVVSAAIIGMLAGRFLRFKLLLMTDG